MENINYTHGTWQSETEARELLQEHVKALTNVTKQLTKDTQVRNFSQLLYNVKYMSIKNLCL